jgi:hypothetical protein
MRYTYALLILALLSIVSFGCTEDPASTDQASGSTTSGVYLFDDGDQYRYIQVPNSRGNVIIRSRVEKDYPMTDLIQDDDCFFVPTRVPTRTGRERLIRLKDEGVWWETASVGAEGDIYLSNDEIDQPPQENTRYMFIIHEFTKSNGKLEVAIESVAHPGFYLTNTGNIMAGNGVTLKEFSSAEKAPRVLIHQISVQQTSGGID